MTKVEEIFLKAKKIAEDKGIPDIYILGPGVSSTGSCYFGDEIVVCFTHNVQKDKEEEMIQVYFREELVFYAEKLEKKLSVKRYFSADSAEWEKLLD